MYRSVQLSRLPISLRESPPAKSRINFARFTNSAANDRLRARRFNSLRSGGANTSRFRFMHSIYQKCYTSHELIALGPRFLLKELARAFMASADLHLY